MTTSRSKMHKTHKTRKTRLPLWAALLLGALLYTGCDSGLVNSIPTSSPDGDVHANFNTTVDASKGNGGPYSNFNFRIDIGADETRTVTGSFESVSGIDSETVISAGQCEIGATGAAEIGRSPRFGNITLKRGIVSAAEFDEWISLVRDGAHEEARGTLTVRLRSDDGKASGAVWQFYEAWPCKWEGFSLDASANEAALEELILAYEGARFLDESDAEWRYYRIRRF